MIFHRYKVFISRWEIVLNIYGSVHAYEEYVENAIEIDKDNLFEICSNLYVYFMPSNQPAQLHPLDYPHMLEGLQRVKTQILQNTRFDKTIITISSVEYDPCCMQEEAFIVGLMEWAAKAFAFSAPAIEVSFNAESNKYDFKF